MLGFDLDIWDYITFIVLLAAICVALWAVVWLAGLPGRIAIARKHPDAEAVQMMGYAGFLAAVPWINAFIWAFKPTDIVDIRRFPKAEAQAIEEENYRLSGKLAADERAKWKAEQAAAKARAAEEKAAREHEKGI